MRDLGVDFLSIPDAYYSELKQRLTDGENLGVDFNLDSIAKQSILLDCSGSKGQTSLDKSGNNAFLLQIFTQPILEQPTFFLEFIERHRQAKGFGEGNFNAFFAAVEACESFKSKRSASFN